MRRAGWGDPYGADARRQFRGMPAVAAGFRRARPPMVPGQSPASAVLPARGLHWVSRLHLMTGIGSYLTAPLWLLFLMLGILISLQAQFVRPEYFPKGFSLFPKWPAQDPVLAAWVFAATMGLLIVPEDAGLSRSAHASVTNGGHSAAAFACWPASSSRRCCPRLIAPCHDDLPVHRRGGNSAGARRGMASPAAKRWRGDAREVYRKFTVPTLCGLAMAVSAYAVSLPLLLWMSPVILGLVCAIPIGLVTSTAPRMAHLFATPPRTIACRRCCRGRENLPAWIGTGPRGL